MSIPIGTPAVVTTNEDVSSTGTLTATDADGDVLTFSPGSVAAADGTVVINSNGTYTYTPNSNFNGVDLFGFKVNDGTSNNADATVSVTVTSVNDAPVADSQNVATNEDAILTGTLTGADAEGDPLIFSTGGVAASHGTVVINPNGTFIYTPNANFNGTDGFSFKVNDGTSNRAEATVSVTVVPINDSPAVVGGNGILDQNSAFNGSLSPLGFDAEGDALPHTTVTQPTSGTLSLSPDGTFTYTPDSGFNGTDSFTFKANDGQSDSNIGTFTFTVNALFDLELSTTPGTIATKKRSVTPLDPTASLINVSPSTDFSNASINVSTIAGADRRDRILVTDGAGGGGTSTATIDANVV